MKAKATSIAIEGVLGLSAQRRVFLAFGPASLLPALSFADTLDEDRGQGYQRRFNAKHSLDFRKYVQAPQSLMSRASLRTMQEAVKRFLAETKILRLRLPETAAKVVLDFWGRLRLSYRTHGTTHGSI